MTRLTTPFTASSTADEVITGVDLSGRRAVVTGAASGIGVPTATALARAGAEVTLAVRDLEAGNRVAEQVAAETGTAVRVARLDLTDREGIDEFTRRWQGPLHILVNNAGVMEVPDRTLTPEGWETQFATNHLGHAALTLGLHDALAGAGDARVVVVSSSAHLISPVVFDDIHFAYRPYAGNLAYGQSKSATVLFAVALAEHWAADGITANALMPGAIATNLQRHMPAERLREIGAVDADGNRLEVPPGWKTPAQGAATSVLLAGSPLVAGATGRYFEDCAEAPVVPDGNGWRSGVAPYVLDRSNAARLWELTHKMLGD